MNIETSVYVPVLLPLRIEPLWAEETAQALDEICGLSGTFNLVTDWPSATRIMVERSPERAGFPELAALWAPEQPNRPYEYLRFATTVDVDIDAYHAILVENNPRGRVERDLAVMFARDLTAESLSRRVADVVLATAIARPGTIHTDVRVLVADGKMIRIHHGFVGLLPDAVEKAMSTGWPRIETVSLGLAWDWLNAIPGFEMGQGKGRIGRAVSAFSYVMSGGVAGAPTMGLMWALVGLEALYAKGNQALQSQLVEKSEVFLGPRSTHKKSFARMYDFRSRFVHGNIDFPLAYVDETVEVDAFEYEARDAELLATATLAATLQEMVRRGLHELEFEYRVTGT